MSFQRKLLLLILAAYCRAADALPTTLDAPGCPASEYNGTSGTLFSPGYEIGAQYPDNADCTYHIVGRPNMHVQLTTNAFDTQICCDILSIYDGPSTNSPLLLKWSGGISAGAQVISSGQQLTAQFSTSPYHWYHWVGFSIQYEVTSDVQICPNGFIHDEASGQCFVAYGIWSTFDDAVASCNSIGGHLAIIHNQATQDAVDKLYLGPAEGYQPYIGLRKTASNDFRWIDGSSVTFSNWMTGEPNNSGDCVINVAQPSGGAGKTGKTGWAVRFCESSQPYICHYSPQRDFNLRRLDHKDQN